MSRFRSTVRRSSGKAEVVARLWGGLGNQLFIYAAARRLALANNANLKLDIHSGFVRDKVYRRHYQLHHFNIAGSLATPEECWETLHGRAVRFGWRAFGRLVPVERRAFLTDADPACRAKLQTLRVSHRVYLEGYWQDENFFKDIADELREDLRIISPHAPENIALAEAITNTNSICLHARVLPGPNTADAKPSDHHSLLSADYYRRAVARMAEGVENPHFFCFSDYPEWLRENVTLNYPATYVSHNRGDSRSYEDFWLMQQCKHFIIANSTFSWWTAWLSQNRTKRVLTPDMRAWGLPELNRPFEQLEAT